MYLFEGLGCGDPGGHLREIGDLFAVFDRRDSGCISYGVASAGRRWFVKVAADPAAAAGLRRAAHLHRTVAHPALAGFHGAVPLPLGGCALVYDWLPGSVLYHPAAPGALPRDHPDSPHLRFRSMPVPGILAALDTVFDLHRAVAAAGFVAVDLYDGCLLYDFAGHRMRVIDLDEYRPGPFRNPSERLPGSTRFMAPEEWVRGAPIDQITNVFTLGRCAAVLLDEVPRRLRPVIGRATRPDRRRRYRSVAAFVTAWERARASGD